MNLKPGDFVLVKVDAGKGKRKIKDRWDEETWEVSWQIAADVPSYEVTNQHGRSRVLHWNWLLLVSSEVGIPLCMGTLHTQDRCTSPTPHKTTPLGGDAGLMPQEQEGIGRFYLMITSTVRCEIREASIVNISMFCLCVYLPSFIIIILFICNWIGVLNKGSTVQGHTEIPGGECHRHENGFRNETTAFRTFGLNGLIGMDANGCADEPRQMFVHVQWFSCQNDRADYHDITWWNQENLSCINGRDI